MGYNPSMVDYKSDKAKKQAFDDCERRRELHPMFASLQAALVEKPFSVMRANRAREALRAAWPCEHGGPDGWASQPWLGMSQIDVGQCGNDYARPSDLRPPLIAATRWGSAKSIAWLCAQPETDPVVKFVDLCDFWAPECAAASGIVGAWDPLWTCCKARGWTDAARAEAYSAWLIGCIGGPIKSLQKVIGQTGPALTELDAAIPNFKVPLSPASAVFFCSLAFAMDKDLELKEKSGAWGTRALILLAAVPFKFWRHEREWELIELGECTAQHPTEPRDFMEHALSIGHLPLLHHLQALGVQLPTSQRIFDLLPEGQREDAEIKKALNWALKTIADQECAVLGDLCAPCTVSHTTLSL